MAFVEESAEKDPRVLLAAERTFLAWIRTGLALMGFGFVVARFGLLLRQLAATSHDLEIKTYGFSLWAGTALVLVGVFVNLASTIRHLRIVGRLNRGEEIVARPSYTAVMVAMILAVVGFATVIFLLSVE